MKLVELSTRRPVTVMMVTTALLIFGMVSLSRLGVNLLPDLSYPTLTIRTEYTGAAPAEVENLITKPVEETLGIIKNIREVRSISRAGQSDVVLEFNWGTDMSLAGLDVREKLDILQLPLDVKRPTLLRFNPQNDPILRLSLSMAKTPAGASAEDTLKSLRRLADEQIKKQLEAIEGVAAVKVSGGLEDEIQVSVDPEKLGQLQLGIEQIAAKLKAENVNLSGGRLEEGQQQFLVRTINQYQSVEEIADAIVATVNERPVYLKDIASVVQGYKERTAITRVNGREAVEIALYKEGDANTVRVAETIRNRLDGVRKSLPAELALDVLYDQSTFIGHAIDDVVENGLVGGLLAVIVLYLFLRNFWVTVIIACTIPLSVVITFNLMYAADVGLNIMSLGGIALSIGMLLDNAIVVLENIASKREQGADILTASREGTSEVAGALLASTLTSVAVFFPLVFVQGIAGQLFRDQALTVTYGQFISLAIGLTLVPMLASLGARRRAAMEAGVAAPTETRGFKGKARLAGYGIFTGIPLLLTTAFMILARAVARLGHGLFAPFTFVFNKVYGATETAYARLLRWALGHRATVLFTALAVFGFSLSLLPALGLELIPQMSQGEFNIAMRLPPGTPLQATDALLQKAQGFAAKSTSIERTFSVSGTGNRLDASPDKGGENWGELNVVQKKPVSLGSEQETMNRLRGELNRIPGLEYKVERPTLFSFKTPLEIEVVGYDLDKLKAVSNQIVAKMMASDRFSDIKSTTEAGHPEVQILFDHERAAHLGLTVPDVADVVVKQLRGDVATRYSFRDRKIDVLVRAQEQQRSSVQKIRELVVATKEGRPVPLSAVADIQVATGPSEIHRVAQERVALISANLRHGDLGQAAQEMETILKSVPMPSTLSSRVAGQSEEMKVSFRSLYMALGLAIFLVYLVMASQFESLKQPLIILFSIPLGLVGAILALWLTGSSISVIVFIGLILLAGVVTNNAIVLMDRINQLRADGVKLIQAIVEAGESRLRPIMMTMMTSVLGMLPLAFGVGEGAEIRQPMAITVIGGLIVATLLTLVVIPVIYALVEREN